MSTELQSFSPNDKPYAKSWGEWSIQWWRWLSSIPRDKHPAYGGGDMSTNNNDPDVFFLTGGYAPYGDIIHVENTINLVIPRDRAIFLPTMNCMLSFAEDPTMHTEEDLAAWTKNDQDDIVIRDMEINGIPCMSHRIATEPFDLYIPENNIYGNPPGLTRAQADGFWVFLSPLSPGQYDIHTAGACALGRTKINALYHITVI